MKAILEFQLPIDEQDHYDAINGSEFKNCIQNLDQQLRNWIKHGNAFQTADEALQATRDYLYQIIHDHDFILK